jgi:hypothetical protein
MSGRTNRLSNALVHLVENSLIMIPEVEYRYRSRRREMNDVISFEFCGTVESCLGFNFSFKRPWQGPKATMHRTVQSSDLVYSACV